MILEHISTPADVKALSGEELKVLCGELRRSLVESVARTGGHLASNLGAVELTVALHRVYDTARDRLVFDVGHQCYVHKMLTGRREQFDTLRQLGGLSGFPKPEESGHDAFVAGHASNSVSVALGMARARTLRGEDYGVAALIGDGALTGGLAYEGLNDAGASGEPMVVILNDNGMSIDPNVGGVATHLSRLRLRPGYYRFKKSYRAVLEHLPGGGRLYRLNHRIKSGVKRAIYPCSMFEDMGFTYLGPVDGHNVEQLCTTLAWAREMACPVLLHVRTVKGKGYKPAEVQPERSHGVAPFDPAVGPDLGRSIDFSYVLGHELVEMAGKDRRLCAVTAAMAEGTGLQEFASAWPKRFFDVGIAEGHAVAMSAGLAKQGMVPVFAVYSSFLQRGFDMLLHDVALQGLHVVLAVDRAGLVGTQIPGMTVLCPACFSELKEMLRWAVGADGPVAVRYPRGGEGRRYPEWTGEGTSLLRQGADVTLVSYGTMTDELLTAAELLAEQGTGAEVVKLHRVAPLDVEPVAESVRRTGRLLVLEDCNENGSIGQQLASALVQSGAAPRKMVLKNLKNAFAPQGTVAQLRKLLGLDAGSVAEAVREML